MDWLTASPWPIIALVAMGAGLLIVVAWYLEWRAMRAYVRLAATGEPAEATVLGARDSGWRTNGRVHLAYKLEVRRPGQAPYAATTRLQIHRPWTAFPYGPGDVVRVRVDRDRPERVVIEGGQPVLGGAVAGAAGSSALLSPATAGPGLAGFVAAAPSAGERLRELRGLYDEGLITAEEYEAKKAAILEQL
jgi:hypothetical protein